jgi:hypothetical protein
MKPGKTIQGPFVPHRLAILRSPAWQALSGQGLKVLDRIELEHLMHGRKDNGHLVIPYSDFLACGIGQRPMIARAIREAEVLGLLAVKRGRLRDPSKYRLTYVPADGADPTNDWSRITTKEEAQAKLQSARRKRPQSEWFKSARLARILPFQA